MKSESKTECKFKIKKLEEKSLYRTIKKPLKK